MRGSPVHSLLVLPLPFSFLGHLLSSCGFSCWLFCHTPSPSACGLCFIPWAPLPLLFSPCPFWAPGALLSSLLWRLVFSPGVFRLPLCSTGSPVVLYLRSWPSCLSRCPEFPLCFLLPSGTRGPCFSSPGLDPLLRCFIAPGSLCLAAMFCVGRRFRLLVLQLPPSVCLGCSASLLAPQFLSVLLFRFLPHFFLGWYVFFRGFPRLSSL